jgi:hypothetical protein
MQATDVSQPTPSGGANVEKTLGFVVFLGALLGDWPDELDDCLRRLTPDLRRGLPIGVPCDYEATKRTLA